MTNQLGKAAGRRGTGGAERGSRVIETTAARFLYDFNPFAAAAADQYIRLTHRVPRALREREYFRPRSSRIPRNDVAILRLLFRDNCRDCARRYLRERKLYAGHGRNDTICPIKVIVAMSAR